MKRYLAFAGLDGNLDALKALEPVIAERKPEALLFAGGVNCEKCVSSAKKPDLTSQQAERYEKWFEWLGKQEIPAAVIPGPYEVPLEAYLRAGMGAEVDYPNVHLVEGTLWEVGDTAVCGAGGTLTEDTTSEYPEVRLSRTMAEYALRMLGRSDRSIKVMLLSTPPTGKLGGECGSKIAGELIDSLHPHLAIVSGPSAHRGMERVAHTWIVNPGRLADGHAAWIDWTRPAEERVELIEVPSLATS